MTSNHSSRSIVNGLRDEDEESSYPSRTSFTSEFSARDGNSDGMPVYVKEHRRNASNGSGTSFTSRRRLLHGKARPETKVCMQLLLNEEASYVILGLLQFPCTYWSLDRESFARNGCWLIQF